jgi:hypothetical protein
MTGVVVSSGSVTRWQTQVGSLVMFYNATNIMNMGLRYCWIVQNAAVLEEVLKMVLNFDLIYTIFYKREMFEVLGHNDAFWNMMANILIV